jgi:hypothetical protein
LIAASFDYGREMMKQAFLFMKTIRRPGRVNTPASALGAVIH